MALTLLLTLICIAGVFLMLFAGGAFIQDRRYLGTAPKDVQEKVQVHVQFQGTAFKTARYFPVVSLAIAGLCVVLGN